MRRTKAMDQRDREIVALAKSGQTYAAIGQQFGITRQRVQQIARDAGLPPRPRGAPRGPLNSQWKGGRFINAHGYVFIRNASHPRASGWGYVAEHIVVAERKLGRRITEDEHVHHINGDRSDNRAENLEVLDPAQHARHHLLRWRADVVLACLRWLALRLGHTPKHREITEFMPFHWHTCIDRFGTTSEAMRRAGLTPNGRGGAGHVSKTLPSGFRRRFAHLAQYRSVNALIAAMGGPETRHEREGAA